MNENLRITIEQDGCLIEVIVPCSLIKEHENALNLKEFLQNSMVDMYARLSHMVRSQREQDNG